MNRRTRTLSRSRRTLTPALDPLESRQLLSAAPISAHEAALVHHHHHLPSHHAAVAGRFHPGHHWGADPATSTGFQVVARFNNASFAATAAIADNDIWAVGTTNLDTSSDTPLAVHFDGTNWSAVPTPTRQGRNDFDGVAAVASNDVWAVGAKDISSTGSAQPLIEHWDGTSWSVVSSPKLKQGGALEAVTAIATNNVWAVGLFDDLSQALVEHWDGTSWSVVSSPAFSGILEVTAISADASNDIWAVTSSPIVLHFDGTNWSQVHAGSEPRYGFFSLRGITALSPTNVWAVGEAKFCNGCGPVGLTGNWDGTSFNRVANPAKGLSSVSAISASNIWAVGSEIEHWDGMGWTTVTAPTGGGGVSTLGDGTVVFVAGNAIVEN
jgi:hypothetical protein